MKDGTFAHFDCFEINKQATLCFDKHIMIEERLFLCYKGDTGKIC